MRVELRLVSESSSMSGKDLEGEGGGRSGDQKWQHCSGLDTGGGLTDRHMQPQFLLTDDVLKASSWVFYCAMLEQRRLG